MKRRGRWEFHKDQFCALYFFAYYLFNPSHHFYAVDTVSLLLKEVQSNYCKHVFLDPFRLCPPPPSTLCIAQL